MRFPPGVRTDWWEFGPGWAADLFIACRFGSKPDERKVGVYAWDVKLHDGRTARVEAVSPSILTERLQYYIPHYTANAGEMLAVYEAEGFLWNIQKRREGIYEVTCGACVSSHKHLLTAMFKAWATFFTVRDLSSGHEIPTD